MWVSVSLIAATLPEACDWSQLDCALDPENGDCGLYVTFEKGLRALKKQPSHVVAAQNEHTCRNVRENSGDPL